MHWNTIYIFDSDLNQTFKPGFWVQNHIWICIIWRLCCIKKAGVKCLFSGIQIIHIKRIIISKDAKRYKRGNKKKFIH